MFSRDGRALRVHLSEVSAGLSTLKTAIAKALLRAAGIPPARVMERHLKI